MPAKNRHNISIGISNNQSVALTLRRKQTDESANMRLGIFSNDKEVIPPPTCPASSMSSTLPCIAQKAVAA